MPVIALVMTEEIVVQILHRQDAQVSVTVQEGYVFELILYWFNLIDVFTFQTHVMDA